MTTTETMSSSTPTPSANSPPFPKPSTVSTSTYVKRACDACHRRKVKCDDLSPCGNCSSTQIDCTYNLIPQKKGPKGSRANVISELREQKRQSALSSRAHAQLLGGLNSPLLRAPSLRTTPGVLTQEIVALCVDYYFANMYPTLPILHRGKLEAQACFADCDLDTYCLLTSLCAFMMIQVGMPVLGDPLGFNSMPGANLHTGTMLMEETIRVRKGYDRLKSPTLGSLATSYFMFGCCSSIDLHDKAWFHLREATTLAYILGMNREDTYRGFDTIDSSRRRRLYWLLFMTERSYALQRHRPLSLQATIDLPTAADDPTEPSPLLTSFIHLVTLFHHFDDTLIALWNKTRSNYPQAYLATLQKQLSDALPNYLHSSESQAATLRINQQWLKQMIWQASMQNGFLSSGNDDPSMTFQKLYDVAFSLTDVLTVSSVFSDPFAPAPAEYITQFLSLLSSFRNGANKRFLPLLFAKVHDVLPHLVIPTLQALSEPSFGVDIFDGFGNAEMGVTSLPHQ